MPANHFCLRARHLAGTASVNRPHPVERAERVVKEILFVVTGSNAVEYVRYETESCISSWLQDLTRNGAFETLDESPSECTLKRDLSTKKPYQWSVTVCMLQSFRLNTLSINQETEWWATLKTKFIFFKGL